jgi:hypothetical protein
VLELDAVQQLLAGRAAVAGRRAKPGVAGEPQAAARPAAAARSAAALEDVKKVFTTWTRGCRASASASPAGSDGGGESRRPLVR